MQNTFVGVIRVTRDPEQNNDSGPVKFNGINSYGEKDNNPLWLEVTCWEERLQTVVKDYVKAGKSLLVTGTIQPARVFNEKAYQTLNASKIDFLPSQNQKTEGEIIS